MIDYKPAVVLDIKVLYFTPLQARNDKEGLGIVMIFLSFCVICICAIPAKPMKWTAHSLRDEHLGNKVFTLRGCSHLIGIFISIRYKYYFKIVFIQEGVHISGVLALGGFRFCIPKITGNFMYLFYKSGCLEQRYGYFQVTRGRFRQFPYKTCLCVFVGVKGGGGVIMISMGGHFWASCILPALSY